MKNSWKFAIMLILQWFCFYTPMQNYLLYLFWIIDSLAPMFALPLFYFQITDWTKNSNESLLILNSSA